MAAMPVVWCTDPNSTSQKPCAFTLQGIQLQGNISEQHVLAVRELINAAAEGRLLLPTDGGIMLLDCGIGVGSVIIQNGQNKLTSEENKVEWKEEKVEVIEDAKDKLEIPPQIPQKPVKEELLYEFLCCARCMTEGNDTKCNKKSKDGAKLMAKYLDARLKQKCLAADPVYNICNKHTKRTKGIRRVTTVSFKSERPQKARRGLPANHKVPVYAVVNKKMKIKNRVKVEIIPVQERKKSVDSVSSLDSGFMDMKKTEKVEKTDPLVEIKIDLAGEETDLIPAINSRSWSRLTIPQQSRNRRKSYEEFKSLFLDQATTKPPPISQDRLEVNNSVKSRRKSYEEFKSVTKVCDNSPSSSPESSVEPSADNGANSLFKMKRKNSKRISTKKSKFADKAVAQKEQDMLYDILKNSLAVKNKYDKNLELFKSNCDKTKIDSYGTIYDIIQRKSDLYNKTISSISSRKYDQYMTYGTLYEILHRKSDEDDLFERKRTSSEKYATRRCLADLSDAASQKDVETGKKSSLLAGKNSVNNQSGNSLSTIYDILQTKKLEGSPTLKQNKNRFLVKKITEEDLAALIKDDIKTDKSTEQIQVPKITIELNETKKPVKMRRFSNILSYTPRILDNDKLKANNLLISENEKKTINAKLELKIDELYSRLNKIAVDQKSKQEALAKGKENLKIYKSSSLDMLSTVNEDMPLRQAPPLTNHNPVRKISSNLLPPKKLQKRNTRRLSEFTRGEFLNEKL